MPDVLREDRRTNLTSRDHQILLRLIRGDSQSEIATLMGIQRVSIGKQIERMRVLVGARSTCELVALETINLMTAGQYVLTDALSVADGKVVA